MADLGPAAQAMTDYRALCAELHNALEPHAETLEEERLLDRSAAALRAALAEPVAEQPSDDELERIYQSAYRPARERGEFYDGAHRDGLRAVLARWGQPHCGQPPAPPAEGEVAALVADLRRAIDDAAAMGWLRSAQIITRAAGLLKRHAAPVPVPVAWCRTDEFNNAMERGSSFNGWIDAGAGASQCDMRLYALPLPAPQGGEVE